MSFPPEPRPKLSWLLLGLSVLLAPLAAAAAVTVSLAPSTATVSTTQTQDFVAVVAGTANKTVNSWRVCDSGGKNCVTGGNSAIGTIVEIGTDADGNPIARYTAPAAVPSPPACAAVGNDCRLTVKVVKRVGLTKHKSTADITITAAPPPVSLTTTALEDGVNAQAYSATLNASGGDLECHSLLSRASSA